MKAPKGLGIRNSEEMKPDEWKLRVSNVIRYKREYPEVTNERLAQVIGLTSSQVAAILSDHHNSAKNYDPSKRRNR